MKLLPENALTTNLDFVHRCEIMPSGGIGHHFHNRCEEMFISFDGQAEFTIDGRTSILRGPSARRPAWGYSHVIYNPSDQVVEFMNINVTDEAKTSRRISLVP